MQFRVGTGFDVHALVENRSLILAGVQIPYEKGLLGHSDADVALHALMDALLGAAGMGDIGKHFPDTDARFEGADSRRLLRFVVEMLQKEGGRDHNCAAAQIGAVYCNHAGTGRRRFVHRRRCGQY